jgi:hypothetical protein
MEATTLKQITCSSFFARLRRDLLSGQSPYNVKNPMILR